MFDLQKLCIRSHQKLVFEEQEMKDVFFSPEGGNEMGAKIMTGGGEV